MKWTKVVPAILALGVISGRTMAAEERKVQAMQTGVITGMYVVEGFAKESCTSSDYTKLYAALNAARDCAGAMNSVQLSGDAGPMGTSQMLWGTGEEEHIIAVFFWVPAATKAGWTPSLAPADAVANFKALEIKAETKL